MKQKLVKQKGEMNKSTIMVSTLLAPSQKLNTTVGQKVTKDLNDTLRTLSNNKINIFSKCPWTIKIDHILSRETKLNKFKSIEIIECIP